jgi:hypothetical protein
MAVHTNRLTGHNTKVYLIRMKKLLIGLLACLMVGTFGFELSACKKKSSGKDEPPVIEPIDPDPVEPTPDSTEDDMAIASAKEKIEAVTYAALQEDISNVGQATSAVMAKINKLDLGGVSVKINGGTFTKAIMGIDQDGNFKIKDEFGNDTAEDAYVDANNNHKYDVGEKKWPLRGGLDGSFTFSVELTKGIGHKQTTALLTLKISATPYTVPTVPQEPREFTVTVDVENVSLTWVKPVWSGAEIIKYQVSCDNGATWKDNGTKTYYTFNNENGIINGASHTFKVRAVNSEGTGAEAVKTENIVITPAPVEGLSLGAETLVGEVKYVNNPLTVSWLAATDPTITNYQILIQETGKGITPASWDNATTIAKQNSYTFTVASNKYYKGIKQTIYVRSKNSKGVSSYASKEFCPMPDLWTAFNNKTFYAQKKPTERLEFSRKDTYYYLYWAGVEVMKVQQTNIDYCKIEFTVRQTQGEAEITVKYRGLYCDGVTIRLEKYDAATSTWVLHDTYSII